MSTLDSILGFGKEVARLRYGRPSDPAQGDQAVPIPAATTVAQQPTSRNGGASLARYVPVVAVLVGALLLGIVLKKSG